jgi:hypothetical protein
MSTSYVVRPVSDATPNDGTGPGAELHYSFVDDDPNDGATTAINFNSAGAVEAFGNDSASVLPGAEIVGGLTVRWAAIGGVGVSSARAGLRIGGASHYADTRTLGPAYAVYEETFDTHPVDGLPWTAARIAAADLIFQIVAMEAGLPRPHLSSLVALVTGRGLRVSGDPAGLAPRAATLADLNDLSAAPASLAPRAVPASLAPSATAVVLNPPKGAGS